MTGEPTFDAGHVARANAHLRAAVGQPPQTFPLAEFAGMIGDEIEALRASGRDWPEIARLIHEATGVRVEADALASAFENRGEHYRR